MGKLALTKKNNKGLEQLYTEGNRDDKVVEDYLSQLLLFKRVDLAEIVLNQLFLEKHEKFFNNKFCRDVFDYLITKADLPVSKYYVENYKTMCNIYGKDVVDLKIRQLFTGFIALYRLNIDKGNVIDENKFAKWVELIRKSNLPNINNLLAEINFEVTARKYKYEEAIALGNKELENADGTKLCIWATLGERLIKGKPNRLQIVNWAQRGITLSKDPIVKKECEMVLADLLKSENPNGMLQRKFIKTMENTEMNSQFAMAKSKNH
jgi:hypothetical protein